MGITSKNQDKKPLKQMRLFKLPLPEVETTPTPATKKAVDRAWTKTAYLVIAQIAKSGIRFTSDLVWAKLGKLKPNEPRALGPVMTAAEKEGLIERVGGASPSTMGVCHGRHKRIWRGKAAA